MAVPSLSSTVFCLYSAPMVGVTLALGLPVNALKRLVLPTALSPSNSILHFYGSAMLIISNSCRV